MPAEKVTVSLIKADVGGSPDDGQIHPVLMKRAEESLGKAKRKGLLLDYRIMRCEDGLRLLLTYSPATSDEKIHKLAWETFLACTEVARHLKLCGAMSYARSEKEEGRGLAAPMATPSGPERPEEGTPGPYNPGGTTGYRSAGSRTR